ncbi:MAG TPA: hypothetical protein PKZ60_09125 [Candidatus Saccharicenans sp.]|nr:hypothetical protein [Candidatus Saccharicenans sp.]
MKNCRYYRQDWLAYLLGELDSNRQKMMAEHLARCQRCQKELNEIKDVIGRTEDWRSELGKTMADIDWDRLQVAITDNVFRQKESQSAAGTAAPLKHRHWQPALAGLVAGLLLGMFFSYLLLRPERWPESTSRGNSKVNLPAGFVQRVDLALAQRETLDYLERSQYLLLELLQAKSPDEVSALLTQDRIQKLLTEKKYLNNQLEEVKLAKAKMLCDQIEMLFLELIQLSPEMSETELSSLREIIENRQLLLKINLVKKELQTSEV